MRKKVASGALAGTATVASTVVGMMWQHIDQNLGMWILVGCAVVFVLAMLAFALPDKKPPAVPSSAPTTHGPNSPAVGSVGRDFHLHQHATQAATQPLKSPYGGARFSADALRLQSRAKAGRDTPLPEGIVWVLRRRWGGSFAAEAESNMAALGKAWQDVGQAAADGNLRIWGRVSRTGKFVEIGPEFWVDHQPEWLSLMRGEAETEATEHGASVEQFFDLMVNRGELSREWRPRWTRGEEDDDGTDWKTI